MKVIYFMLCIAVLCGCENKPKGTKSIFSVGVPSAEISVKNVGELRNASSVPDFIKNKISDTNHIVVLTSADEIQYLIAFQDTSMPKGNFIGIEITHLSNQLLDYPSVKTNSSRFTTTNGLHIGMTEEELFKAKGQPNDTKSDNGLNTYLYFEASDKAKPDEEYILECETANNTISRMRFGFVPVGK